MSDDDSDLAGFLGGLTPQPPSDPKPDSEKKAAAPDAAQAPASSEGIGFLGGLATPVSSPAATPESQPTASSAGDASASSPDVVPSPSSAPADATPMMPPAAPDVPEEPETSATPAVSLPVEEPQPMPPADAPADIFYARAEELEEQGFLASAVTAYRKGLDKDPDNAVALNNLAVVLLQLERYNEARVELERAVPLDGSNPDLFNNLGFVLRKLENDIAAANAYRRYLELAPHVEEAPMIQSWIDQVLTDSDEVAAVSSLSETPSNSPGAGRVGSVAPASKTEAIIGPSPAEEACMRDAERLYDEEVFGEALDLYNDVLKRLPDYYDALLGRGKCLIKLEEMTEGEETLRHAASLRTDDPELFYILGFARRRMGNDRGAAQAYDTYLQLEPDSEHAGRIRDWIESVRRQFPVAQEDGAASGDSGVSAKDATTAASDEDYSLKVEKQPAWASALEALADESASSDVGGLDVSTESAGGIRISSIHDAGDDSSADAGLPAEAMSPVTSGISADSASEPVDTPAQTKALPPAERMFRHGLREAQNLLQDGQVDDALAKAQELVGMDPDSLEAKLIIARCFGRRQDFSKAQAILQNILGVDEGCVEAHMLIGQCQLALHTEMSARKHLERVIVLAPGTDLAHRAQELLDHELSGKLGICSGCGASVPQAELKSMEGGQICTECQEKLHLAMGGQMILDGNTQAAISQARRDGTSTARFRRKAATRGRLLKVLTVGVLLFVMVCGGVFSLQWIAPEMYQQIMTAVEPYAPFLANLTGEKNSPKVPQTKKTPIKNAKVPDATSVEQPDVAAVDADTAPQAGPTFAPAPEKVMVGMPLLLPVRVLDAQQREISGMRVEVAFVAPGPVDAGHYDSKTRIFMWTPAAADAGKTLTLSFNATRKKERVSAEAKMRVLPAPVVHTVPGIREDTWTPGDPVFMQVADLTGDLKPELILVYGAYVSGKLRVYQHEGGAWKLFADIPFDGRPAGLQVSYDKGGSTCIVSDWWNQSLRGCRFTSFKEPPYQMSSGTPLPERPLFLAQGWSFQSGAEIILTDKQNVMPSAPSPRRHSTPDASLSWKWFGVGNFDPSEKAAGHELILAAYGHGHERNVFVMSPDSKDQSWTGLSIGRGAIEAITLAHVFKAGREAPVDLAVVTGGSRAYLEIRAGGEHVNAVSYTLPEHPTAIAGVDLDGDGFQEVVTFGMSGMVVSNQSQSIQYPMEGMTEPMVTTATGDVDNDGREEVFALTRGGHIAVMEVPDATE